MANILEGIIKVSAPGVVQTTNQVSTAIQKTERSMKSAGQAGFAFNQILREAPAFAFSFQTGLIGISNNLPIFTDALKKAREQGVSTGEMLKTLGANLFSLPALLSLGVTALAIFAGNARKAKEETEALNKETSEANKKQEEFRNAVNAAANSVIGQKDKLVDLRDVLTSATKGYDDLTDATIRQGLAQLIFSQKESAILKALSAEIEKQFILRQRGVGVSGASAITNDPQLEFLEKVYQANLKLGRNDTGLKQTIDRIKELNKTIGDSGGVVNTLNSMSGGLEGIFKSFIRVPKVTLKPEKVEIDLDKERVLEISDGMKTSFEKDLSFSTGGLRLQPSNFLREFRERNDAQLKPIRDRLNELIQLGEFAGSKLADAFNSAFAAIANGKSPVRALGEAVKSLVTDLIQAALRAFLIKQIVNLFAPGAGAVANLGPFGSLFGGFRASGGPVHPGKAYVVGENGPELFNPGTSGSILPNSALSSYSGGSLAGRVVFEISGNKLIGVLANGNRSQGSLV